MSTALLVTAYAAELDHDGTWGVWCYRPEGNGRWPHTACESHEQAEQLAAHANRYGLPSIIGAPGTELLTLAHN